MIPRRVLESHKNANAIALWSIAFLVLVRLNYAIAPRILLIERVVRWIIQVLSGRIRPGRALPGEGRQKRRTNTTGNHASEKEALGD
jgi:hypothetical protein